MTSLLVKVRSFCWVKPFILLTNQKLSIEFFFKIYIPLLRKKKKVSDNCGQEYKRADATRHRKRFEKQKNVSAQTVIFIQRAKRRLVIMLRRSMLKFVLLVNKSSQVTTLLQQHRRKEHVTK